ncbi:hypothetical protein MASR1M31_08460 [Porphyromonadaceae bacterium]
MGSDHRPEQLITALPEVMRVLTSPAKTAFVTRYPQEHTEAYDFPVALFEKRVWHIACARLTGNALKRAAELIRQSKSPMIIAGGGVLYSEASTALNNW